MSIGLRQDELERIIDKHFDGSEHLSIEDARALLIDVITQNNNRLMRDLPRALDEVALQKKRVSLSQ